MSNRLPHVFLIASMIFVTAATTGGADARWNRVAPEGAGFSVEAPGEPQANLQPGDYTFFSGRWCLAVKVESVDPVIRQLVESGDRKAATTALDAMMSFMLASMKATGRRSSSGEIDGYPYLRFSLETAEFDSTNMLVLTPQQMYIVVTVGPKGARDDDAKRFLRSFRLVTTNAAPDAEFHAAAVWSTLAINGDRS
jgi:hypothetical protein